MDPTRMFGLFDVTGSGMSAQRERMSLIAQNIAHAQDTNRGDGLPWRRREAVFETVLEGEMAGRVTLAEVQEDFRTPMNRVRDPGHRDADAEGFVTYPNVNPIFEMTDLLAASRAYEANLQTSKTFRQMVEQALGLGR
ncbi:MAG TPA: flagellar basal body rod protein FlgC [Planctomycetota bacterium]|nr:flagellar basal body rod protein FlgC [Planctomycetota bacterium]